MCIETYLFPQLFFAFKLSCCYILQLEARVFQTKQLKETAFHRFCFTNNPLKTGDWLNVCKPTISTNTVTLQPEQSLMRVTLMRATLMRVTLMRTTLMRVTRMHATIMRVIRETVYHLEVIKKFDENGQM